MKILALKRNGRARKNEYNQGLLIRTPKGQSLMSDIQIYRSGVCYLGTCNIKGVHKENFDCLWDPEWCTLESKVSFIASLQVDFLRDEVARSFPS